MAEEVRRVHGPTLVSDIVSADDQVDATLLTERLLSAIATTCAALALGLAAWQPAWRAASVDPADVLRRG